MTAIYRVVIGRSETATRPVVRPPLAFDTARRRGAWFEPAKAVERVYARKLIKVARQIGALVSGFDPADPIAMERLDRTLRRYAEILEPWAARFHEQPFRAARSRNAAFAPP